MVDIVCDGAVIAKGSPSYSSKELSAIAGKHSEEIEKILGYRLHADAILSENIALLII
ncbi:MAG: hypothetical protein IKG94_09815 [Candidatus Methanomethylophilaceae archaeon]|nr:hypothetical protein [Candidatus Methanomethylophilaceae archaeon]